VAAKPGIGFLQALTGGDSVSVAFDLKGAMQSAANSPLSKIPAFIAMPTSLNPKLAIQHGPGGTEFAVQFELDSLQMTLGGAALHFDTIVSFKAGTAATDQPTIEVRGILESPWQNPFGINGFTLEDSASIDVTVAADGQASVAATGKTLIGTKHVDVVASASMVDGAVDSGVFLGTVDEHGLSDLAALANTLVAAGGSKATIDGSNLPPAQLKQVSVAFASPGTNVPSVGLTDGGIRFKGQFWFMKENLGNATVDADGTGFAISGSISDISVGPLAVTSTSLDVQTKTTHDPFFIIGGTGEVLGVSETLAVLATTDKLVVTTHLNLGGDYLKYFFKASASGVDWSTISATDVGNLRLYLDATLTSDLKTWLTTQATSSKTSFSSPLNAALTAARTDSTNAQTALDAANTRLNSARHAARSAEAPIQNELTQAKKRVHDLHSKIDGGPDPSCDDWDVVCKAAWGVEKAVYETAKTVAEALVTETQHVATSVAINLDATLLPLVIARDAALAPWYVAKGVLAGLQTATSVVSSAESALSTALSASDVFVLHSSRISGDYGGANSGSAVVLELDYSLSGTRYNDSFAFKMKDWSYNETQLELLAYKLVESAYSQVSSGLTDHIKDQVHGKMLAKSHTGATQLQTARAALPAGHTAAASSSSVHGAAYDSQQYHDQRMAALAAIQHEPLATFPATEPFTHYRLQMHVATPNPNDHTSLRDFCMDWSGTDLMFDHCNYGRGVQKWSAVPTEYGYAKIVSAGNCLHPVHAGGAGDHLQAGTCGDEKKSQWKVIPIGSDRFALANRKNGLCFNFFSWAEQASLWHCHSGTAQALKKTMPGDS
jgi:hypothetical protein